MFHNSSSLLTPYEIFVEKEVQIVSRKTLKMLNIFECLIRKGKWGKWHLMLIYSLSKHMSSAHYSLCTSRHENHLIWVFKKSQFRIGDRHIVKTIHSIDLVKQELKKEFILTGEIRKGFIPGDIKPGLK